MRKILVSIVILSCTSNYSFAQGVCTNSLDGLFDAIAKNMSSTTNGMIRYSVEDAKVFVSFSDIANEGVRGNVNHCVATAHMDGKKYFDMFKANLKKHTLASMTPEQRREKESEIDMNISKIDPTLTENMMNQMTGQIMRYTVTPTESGRYRVFIK